MNDGVTHGGDPGGARMPAATWFDWLRVALIMSYPLLAAPASAASDARRLAVHDPSTLGIRRLELDAEGWPVVGEVLK